MQITVIGAGSIGSAIARDLCDRQDINQVQVCDSRPGRLEAIHDRIHSPSLRTFQVNARDPNTLTSIVQGSNCIVSCVPSDLNPILSEMALNMGIHFCDLGGNEEVVQHQLELDEEARQKAVWIVPNCGLAPGLINVICMHGIEQLDEVRSARVRVGDVPLNPEPPFKYRLSYDAEKFVEDYTTPATVINEGRTRRIEPLTEIESITFDAPYEELEAFHTSGGLSTLPDDLEGRVNELDYKTIRYPGHALQMKFLLSLGFAEKRAIDVRTHLTYRDVLVRKLSQRMRGDFRDVVILRVVITGERDGAPKSLVYEMIEEHQEGDEMSAMQRCTALPVSVVACQLASQSVPGGGATPPEHVVSPNAYLEEVRQRGLSIDVTEHDGHVPIENPELAHQTA